MKIQLGWLVVGLLLLGGCGPRLPTPGPLPAGASFVGEWSSNWGTMKLMGKGEKIFGYFSGFRNGSLDGLQEGDLLIFKWTQKERQLWGRGYLRIAPDGQTVDGRWGYKKDHDGGGRWYATKISSGPEP
jgi:hypothetical protein